MPAVIQNVGAVALGGVASHTFTVSSTGGSNTLVIECGIDGTGYTDFTVSDNAPGGSNTYVTRVKLSGSGSARLAAILDCLNPVGGVTQITVTGTGGSGGIFGCMAVQELPGKYSFDQSGSVASTSSSPTAVTASGADVGAADFVAACCCFGNGFSNTGISDPPTTGYTSAAVNQDDNADTSAEMAYRFNSGAVTDSATWAWTTNLTGNPAVIASYQAPVGDVLQGQIWL